jgi:hypothetical protein
MFCGSRATGAVAKLAGLLKLGRPLVVGSFSAASNVTGILTDTDRVAALLHRHGALSVWTTRPRRRTCRSGWSKAAPGPATTRTPSSSPRTS